MNGFDSQGLVTGADYDPESKTLVVVGYSKPLYKPFLYLIYDFDDAGEKLSHRRLEMPQWSGAQTEGICFFDKGQCFISAEWTPAFTARVFVADFNKLMNKDLKNKQRGFCPHKPRTEPLLFGPILVEKQKTRPPALIGQTAGVVYSYYFSSKPYTSQERSGII